jgi:phosphoribosylanthranilate isomerase
VVTRAKICGIRSDRDLELAAALGADAVGFICGTTHLSEDALSPDEARRLSRRVPPYVARVLVTHLTGSADILALADHVEADTIQVHGLVTPETTGQVFRAAAGRRVTRALHVTGPEVLDEARALLPHCHALHLDSRTEDRLGGTGLVHDWSVSAEVAQLARAAGRPVVLAGGLRPANVAAAIEAVRPSAVDVNSGVEDANGDKDPGLVAAFLEAVRRPGAPAAAPTAPGRR